jgi:hypothetical protein
MKCDFCDRPAVSIVGEQNHLLVCPDHLSKDRVFVAESDD